MPTFRHGKATKVIVNTTDLTSMFRGYSSARDADAAETTAFGSSNKTFVVGIPSGTLSLEGMFSGAAGEVDDILSSAFGSSSLTNVTVGVEGLAIGTKVVFGSGWETSYQVQGSFSDIVSVSAQLQASGGLYNGVCLHPLQAETAAGNYTGQDFLTTSTAGGVGMLHVTANTMNAGTVIKLQTASTQGGAYTDIGTFTTVGAATTTSERLVVAPGTSEQRWIRAAITSTGTGSITFTVSYARNTQ